MPPSRLHPSTSDKLSETYNQLQAARTILKEKYEILDKLRRNNAPAHEIKYAQNEVEIAWQTEKQIVVVYAKLRGKTSHGKLDNRDDKNKPVRQPSKIQQQLNQKIILGDQSKVKNTLEIVSEKPYLFRTIIKNLNASCDIIEENCKPMFSVVGERWTAVMDAKIDIPPPPKVNLDKDKVKGPWIVTHFPDLKKVMEEKDVVSEGAQMTTPSVSASHGPRAMPITTWVDSTVLPDANKA